MPLDAFMNTFAGNPLDRSSYRRADPDWVKGKLADPDSLALVMWNGRPMVETRKSTDGGKPGAQIACRSR